MTVYTKRGDQGKTSLFNKKTRKETRVFKNSKKIEAIGSLDELNALLGIVKSLSKRKALKIEIEEIQRNIFTIGSILAGTRLPFPKEKTKELERKIDEIEKKLPVVRNFTLPGGDLVSANLHLARSVCRRFERKLVGLKIGANILSYVNRLSDFLFILAREENRKKRIKESIWKE